MTHDFFLAEIALRDQSWFIVFGELSIDATVAIKSPAMGEAIDPANRHLFS